MIHLHGDNCMFYYPVCSGTESSVYIKKNKKNKLQSGPSSPNTQTHAIQMNFSPHDKDFRAKHFGHEIHAREIDACCLGNY